MNNQQDVTSVLFELIDTIQNFSESMYSFLCHIGDREVLNPFKKIDFTALTEYLPAIFFERFGIQRIILNALPLRSSIGNHWFSNCDKKNKSVLNWNSIKNDVNIEDLKAVFRGSDIIQFADWASVYNASNIWDGFLSDVIKPLN